MRKIGKKGITILLLLSFALADMFSPRIPVAAAGPDGSRRMQSALDDENSLNIGIPDFPRRVGRELPEASKDLGIKAGILKLHPSFTTSFEFDDNVELADSLRTKEKQDGIFTQKPGLAAEMKLGNHRLEGGYGMEIQNFAKNPEENRINHMAYGLGEFNFNDFQLIVEDNFEKSTSRLFSETSSRDHLRLNEVHVLGRYDRPRWATELGWTHNTVDHLTEQFELNNYNEDIIGLLGGYKFLPKTLFLAEVDWGNVYYDQKTATADQTYVQLLGGVRGEPTEDLSVTVKAGFQNRQLEDVPNEGRQTDYQGLVVNSDLVYKITKSDLVRLGYVRTVKTSTFQTNSWYREDKVYLSYRKRLFAKWYLTPSISWQLNDYPEGSTVGSQTLTRTDNFLQAGLSVRYKIKDWAWTGITYNFRERNSNFNSLDYDNNRLIVDLSFIY